MEKEMERYGIYFESCPGKGLFEGLQVGSLFVDHPKGDIVTVHKEDTISCAFKIMMENRILSLPVYDPHKRSYTSFIDIVDVVSFLMEKMKDEDLSKDDHSGLIEAAKEFKETSCGHITDISHRNPFNPVESRASFSTSIHLMAKWGVHRIPVVDAEGELATILTQSHVVKFLYTRINRYPVLAAKTIEALDMIHKGVISVPHRSSAIEAFKAMHTQKVSAVAVVDHDGKLVGNISVSDIKIIGSDAAFLSRLFYPISQFLKILPEGRGEENVTIEAPVSVKSSATLREVLEKFVTLRIHRIYVVDDDNVPVGVVSQLEVTKALSTYIHQ